MKRLPIALTIAGSDSGGGAGIQADLKTFAGLGVHGTSVVTCVTAQNPKRVLGVEPASPKILRQQLEAVFAELPPKAAKTGMLFSREIINAVVAFWKNGKRPPLIIDPVMISTSGRRLLEDSAIHVLQNKLLPLATLITPNLSETEALLGERISSVDQLRAAAQIIHQRYGCAALVKGGHLRGSREAIDFFYDGKTELMLSAPFVKNVKTHGTGCVYSAAITAHSARGHTLPEAVKVAKGHITSCISNSAKIGKHSVLNFEPQTSKLKP